jgi:hypothetical protein
MEGVMDIDLMEALAKRAGLDKALAEHRADVAVAFAQVDGHRAALAAPEKPAAEPWPPMRVARTS